MLRILALTLSLSLSTRAAKVKNPAVPMAPPQALAESAAPSLTAADLAPSLPGPAGQAAQALFGAGKYRQALPALEALPPSPAARYLAALCLLHLDREAEAAARFTALASALPALAGRCQFHAGGAYEDAGQLADAERAYAAVSPDEVVWGPAQLGLARVRWARRDARGALSALAPLANRPWQSPGQDLQAQALVFMARVAQASGLREVARDAELLLWAEHPLARISDAALAGAERLGLKAPSELIALRRAEVLLDANRNDRALDALAPLLGAWKLPSPHACLAHFLYGKGLRKERKHQAALDALAPVIAQCRALPALRVRALYVAGSSGSIVDPAQGTAAYAALAHDYPSHRYADDALFFAADIAQKRGDVSGARRWLRKLADDPAYRDGDMRPEGMFRLAWLDRQGKEAPAALAVLSRIINEYAASRPAQAIRAEYWRARTLAEVGEHGAARLGLLALLRAHPTSYYALLARSRLGDDPGSVAIERAVEVLPRAAPAVFQPGLLARSDHFRAALALLRMGLGEEASDELMAVPRAPLRADASDALPLLVELLARAGNARAAQAVARTELAHAFSGALTPWNLGLWQAAYPLAFRPDVERACRAAKVPPDLFQALIREESALDPHVVSWAGAVGLSQLMPSTARSVARQMHLRAPITVASLQSPALNLSLGAHYVGSLLERFHGNPALALASYNAGAGAVRRWLRAHGDDDLDAFVEEIPIAETRGYVKRVLQTFNVYQLLYSHRAAARLPRQPLPALAGKTVAAAP